MAGTRSQTSPDFFLRTRKKKEGRFQKNKSLPVRESRDHERGTPANHGEQNEIRHLCRDFF
jgi:hypothetical protein